MWAAHHMDVARNYSRINYNNTNWEKLYKSLQLLFQIEALIKEQDIVKVDYENIQKQIFKEMDEVEEELDQDGRSNPVLNESQPIII